MDPSPNGNEICALKGNPGLIHTRGTAITTLGEQMISSARLLESIADGASGQEGLAVDKLQEIVGECYKELKLAGERYKPTGPVLVTYAGVLSELQPVIAGIVEDCEEEWLKVSAKRSEIWEANSRFYIPEEPPSSDASCEPPKSAAELKADAVQDARDEADDAYDKWEIQAKRFDTQFDTWELAFDTAASAIGDATEGGIQDSTWDNIDGWVAGALEVLQWVGLALAILGVIIGGPFIAALAAIVAIATLLLTIYSFCRGNSTVGDLVFAVIGVIPFGSIGKAGFVSDMFGGMTSSKGWGLIGGDLKGIGQAAAGGFRSAGGGLPGIGRGLLNGVTGWGVQNGSGAGNILSRLFTGQTMSHFDDVGAGGGTIISGVLGDGFVKNIFGIPDGPLDLHNSWFESPELGSPLFGTPKR